MSPSIPRDASSRGYIIPIGGAEEKFHNPEILDRFVEVCGGKQARISIIPTASELEDTGRNYEKLFRRLGDTELVDAITQRDRILLDGEVAPLFDLVGRHAHDEHDAVAGAAPETGRVSAKIAPSPGSESTQIWPPCSSTSWRVIVRPRPVPPNSRAEDASAC